jgi:hypothetical protein
MKARTILLGTFALLIFVSFACATSEVSWANRENTSGELRELVGLPSIVVGNLNPAARNPGLETLCTGLYDNPGGYCGYFTDGVPFVNSTVNLNITVSDGR